MGKFNPDAVGGAIFQGPPYDLAWSSTSGKDGSATIGQNAGTYNLAIQGFGDGNQYVSAGLGFQFFSGDGNLSQRCAAFWDYYDDWFDNAMGYVAHNDCRTYLWVWGEAVNAWVAQSNQSPSWSDGASWLDSHGNDPVGDDGNSQGQVFFNTQPSSWYQCWMWSSASIYTDSGFFGFSDSSIHLNITIPFFVLGSVSL